MGIEIKELEHDLVEIGLTGKLTAEDYDEYRPVMEKMIERGEKIRILMIMHDFHGWEMAAMWEDTKFDMAHHGDLSKIAMVGDKKWEEWMAKVCRPFTKAEIKYWDVADVEEARAWVSEG